MCDYVRKRQYSTVYAVSRTSQIRSVDKWCHLLALLTASESNRREHRLTGETCNDPKLFLLHYGQLFMDCCLQTVASNSWLVRLGYKSNRIKFPWRLVNDQCSLPTLRVEGSNPSQYPILTFTEILTLSRIMCDN